MAYYAETKVYFDGSHYVGIPRKDKTYKRKRYRFYRKEREVILDENNNIIKSDMEESVFVSEKGYVLTEVENKGGKFVSVKKKKKGTKRISLKDSFEKAYKEYCMYSKYKMKSEIMNEMRQIFPNDEKLEEYVDDEIKKKLKNKAVRKIRCYRKAGLQTWNYFTTFTYDDKLQTEESFKKKLKRVLSNFSSRKGWKYIGVWERGEDSERLHFHCILSIPEGGMVGELIEKKDYNTKDGKVQITHQNTFFSERFGRNDFKSIDFEQEVTEGLNYILKYIEKSGEKIVYSKHLPTFFISDIMEDDIMGEYGEYEGHKLVLFDKFLCIDMGEIIGRVSKEIIKKMRYAY